MQENNYCVYVHKKKTTGEIFYVGSGTRDRARTGSGRSKSWKAVVEASGFISEIVADNLCKKASLETEKQLYLELKEHSPLVNKKVQGILKESDLDFLTSRYFYDETSPTMLRHKVDVTRGRKNANFAARKGDVAGCNTETTRSISVKGFVYPIYRVIWMLNYGEIPAGYVVDHIDGDVSNNRISNLRIVTYQTNTRNRAKPRTNTSGVVGVYLLHYNSEPNRWCASWVDANNKRQRVYFQVSKYGNEEAFRLACEYRAQKIRELNEQGAGYTERHGT